MNLTDVYRRPDGEMFAVSVLSSSLILIEPIPADILIESWTLVVKDFKTYKTSALNILNNYVQQTQTSEPLFCYPSII